MIYLFFSLLFVEMVTILLLLFKTPLRKLLIIGIDRMKRGRAPLVVKSVGATVFVIMMYNVYSVTEIQSRPPDAVNPTDQIILAYHMLEASLMGNSLATGVNYYGDHILVNISKPQLVAQLTEISAWYKVKLRSDISVFLGGPVLNIAYTILSSRGSQPRNADLETRCITNIYAMHTLLLSSQGFSLFLSLMVDRLHHYIRELRILRKTVEAAKKQNRAAEDGKNKGADEVKILHEETSRLQSEIKRLESEYEAKVKEVKSAEANSVALKNQSEGFLLEYDRLLAENQSLRDQLRSIDECLSHSNGKKDT
ncbi:hypothetical protein OSB04_006067 [Centaurea solstitialis]|uniref:Endoplasmic reticulum transmembrane protein n=1 Tax=Centaurea solstitialis TaxID=347529 RepID=A0AA38U0C1_9ASTR|nr:hypothetical protein OSB04_006067 [Centaurea solstitialis]